MAVYKTRAVATASITTHMVDRAAPAHIADVSHHLRALRTSYYDIGNGPEPFISLPELRHLANALLDDGSCKNPERAMFLLQDWSEREGKGRIMAWCAHCAKRVGVTPRALIAQRRATARASVRWPHGRCTRRAAAQKYDGD
jgi:hypothetical protein